jgi:hypothetical protein
MSNKRETDENLEEPSKYSIPEQEYLVQIKIKPEAGVRVDAAYRLSSKTDANLSSIENILTKHDVKLERAFEETEDALEESFAEAKAVGVDLPDLSRSYIIRTKDKEAAEAVAKDLIENELVEVAEVTPPAVPAEADIATSSFFDMQGYLDPAPGGIDAKYAWTKPGGKGTGIKVIDIEGAWNFNHEDLLDNQSGLAGGSMANNLSWRNHGTAVIGEIGGDENTFGVTGIAPECDQRGYSIFGTGNATYKAIKGAADLLSPGDIILIELHRPGPDAPDPENSQEGFIAIEWWTLDFDAIKYATSKGVIVVEAAGNGSRDLDAPIFQNKFNRLSRDSGAILVGAGAPPSGNHGPDRSRLSFSNWGAIIDTQGWGREVVTTGYGDLQGGDENKWYTKYFSGTSSASPIITGAIACLQGIRKAKGELPLTFSQLRDELRTTGSPQQDHPARPMMQRIGNRPDLKEILTKDTQAYTLTVNIVNNGSVSKVPDSTTYSGEIVQLTANPATGWEFSAWSGDLTGSTNPNSIIMNGDKVVTAFFKKKCPIAMVTIGSILVPHVNFLRMYRDEIVLKSVFRNHFEKLLAWYYQLTPYVVRKMDESTIYEKFVKYIFVYPFVFLAKIAVLSAQVILGVKIPGLGIFTRTKFTRCARPTV